MQIIIDTSCIVGLIDKSCNKHEEIKMIVSDCKNDIIIPSPVIPETCYMLNKKFGPEIEIKFIEEMIKANLLVEIGELPPTEVGGFSYTTSPIRGCPDYVWTAYPSPD